MEKVSEMGIEKYTEQIGNDGAVMEIRVETTADGVYVSAPVKKGEKSIALLSRQTDSSIVLSIDKNAALSPVEFFDMFNKSADVLAEILKIDKPE